MALVGAQKKRLAFFQRDIAFAFNKKGGTAF